MGKRISAAVFIVLLFLFASVAIAGHKKIAFGDNLKVRFSVVRKVLYTFLYHEKGQADKARSNPSTLRHAQGRTPGHIEGSTDKLFGNVQIFADAVGILRNEYAEELNSKKLIYGAMRGMLGSLDDYSVFLEPDELKELEVESRGEFGGIGVEITLKDGVLTIIAPMAGTPAEEAGIMPGDMIVEIGGKLTRDMKMTDAMKVLRGKPGTSVKLTLWRDRDQKIHKVEIRRAIIKIKSVTRCEFLEEKVGYIRLAEFQANTPRELEDALKKLESQGMDSLILDLRNNPGGLLDVSVDIAEKFLPKDSVIVSVKARNPEQNAVFKSRGKFTHLDYPLIVLVNEGSASASEIVAGAVQDNKRGILVGTKTFGKAAVQAVVPLKDRSAIKFTTAYYLTPSGKMIKGDGIKPDVIVEYTPELSKKTKEEAADIFDMVEGEGMPSGEKAKRPGAEEKKKKAALERDNQLQSALNLIKSIKIYKNNVGHS
jgi:carboxyl-terminal processing protease